MPHRGFGLGLEVGRFMGLVVAFGSGAPLGLLFAKVIFLIFFVFLYF